MSALSMSQSSTAVGVNIPAFFLAVGGTPPYTFTVLAGGAGGTIAASTGNYTAPAVSNSNNPNKLYDQIQATDSTGAFVRSKILVGTPLLLFCDVIQNQLGLDNQHVYLWDQKIFQPTDFSLYVAISEASCKPFGNTNYFDSDGNSEQSVNMMATLDLDIISRGPDARDRKEEVIMALNSNYAQSQQEINGFYIGKLSPSSRFINLSMIDGAAIPYRFKISVNMQYTVTKVKPVPYFDTFSAAQVTVNA